MRRFKCPSCCRETFGGKAPYCHGTPMDDMGEWSLPDGAITAAPMIVRAATYQYQCPITGKDINGKRDHEANLARHGCRVLESGEAEDAQRRRKQAAADFDRALDTGIDKIIDGMGHDKRESLVKELTVTT